MLNLRLKQERALGNGTRPKGFILGAVDSLEEPQVIQPAEGVEEREIRIALLNGLCSKCAVEVPEPDAPEPEQTPSSETSTRKSKR